MHKNRKSILLSVLFLMFFSLNTNSAQAAGCTDINDINLDYVVNTNETLCGNIKVKSFTVMPNRIVTVKAYNPDLTDSPNNTGRLIIEAEEVNIKAGGKIDASGKGFAADSGPGAGIGGNYSSTASGAGHGGRGGNSTYNAGGISYGSFSNPETFGSGGRTGTWSTGGGRGGGLIKITAGNVTIKGNLESNGLNGSSKSYGGGGGAGGSINIIANTTFTSNVTGLINANGGNAGTGFNGSGAGGRVAIYVPDDFLGTINAHGGSTVRVGGAGTIYKKIGTDEHLTINNGDISYNSPPTTLSEVSINHTFQILDISGGGHLKIQSGENIIFENTGIWSPASLTLDSGGVLTASNSITTIDTIPGIIYLHSGSTFNFPDLTDLIINDQSTFVYSSPVDMIDNLNNITVKSGGILTHDYNTNIKDSFIDFTLSSLIIEAGGKIDASGKGFALNERDGAGNSYNWKSGSGGGYGGIGGASNGGIGGVKYGLFIDPNNLGSGGGDGHLSHLENTGGMGGGLVKIIADNIILNGEIEVNGFNGGSYFDNIAYAEGGGSGGSVKLIINNDLIGNGNINVYGGIGGYSINGGGGGAGGRIAYYTNSTKGIDFTFLMNVDGGIGYEDGEAGTIFEGLSPTLENLNIINMDPCLYNNGYIFNWDYVPHSILTVNGIVIDTDTTVQKAYRLQVYDTKKNGNLADDELIWDTGIVNTSDNSVTHIFTNIAFDKTFRWQVQAWDESDLLYTSVINGSNFDTMPHAYPEANFTYTPANPTSRVIVDFTANSGPGYTYFWDFDDSYANDEDKIVENNSTSTEQNPQHFFLADGHNVSVKVADSDGHSCVSASSLIKLKSFPKFTETSPK